jgi:hypothetical protein
MGLTQSQKSIIEKARAAGGGDLGVGLDDAACSYLVAVIAFDLGFGGDVPGLPEKVAPFFSSSSPDDLVVHGLDFWNAFDILIKLIPDADTYFSCLAALYKSRMKYWKILSHQAVPTMDQVGPRSLLQYGHMNDAALAAFLLWRKWLFDIDNRAGQETGYLFEPIIANSIGGYPASSRKSPVRRGRDSNKGRQVDCIRGKMAYEIKIRVTIAASGQGRWQEELDFPLDCVSSGYTPILVVLDPTPNPKLDELIRAFEASGGTTYIGAAAWAHLEEAAGSAMSVFLEKYVRTPIQSVLSATPPRLPDITLSMDETRLALKVLGNECSYPREAGNQSISNGGDLPEDIDDETPGI